MERGKDGNTNINVQNYTVTITRDAPIQVCPFCFYLFVLFFSFLFPGPILKDLKYLQFLTNICNGFQSISTAAMPWMEIVVNCKHFSANRRKHGSGCIKVQYDKSFQKISIIRKKKERRKKKEEEKKKETKKKKSCQWKTKKKKNTF